jgi:hypothetical protein
VNNIYKILRFKRYYLIANTQGSYSNHTHIKVRSRTGEKEYKVCKTLVGLIENKRIPKSNYLLQSAIRLTLDEEYKEQLLEVQQRRKQRYFNVNKGANKCIN